MAKSDVDLLTPSSLTTRAISDVVKAAGFDLVVVETPGIGQGDAAIVPVRRHRDLRDDPRVLRCISTSEEHARFAFVEHRLVLDPSALVAGLHGTHYAAALIDRVEPCQDG